MVSRIVAVCAGCWVVQESAMASNTTGTTGSTNSIFGDFVFGNRLQSGILSHGKSQSQFGILYSFGISIIWFSNSIRFIVGRFIEAIKSIKGRSIRSSNGTTSTRAAGQCLSWTYSNAGWSSTFTHERILRGYSFQGNLWFIRYW